MKLYRVLRSLFCLLFISSIDGGTINFRGNSSFIHVFPGASFVVNQPMESISGALIRDTGGTISGSNVTFSGGLLQELGNSMLLNSVFNPTTSTVTLNGGNNFIKESRGVITKTVNISGSGARVEGAGLLTGPLTLADANTTTTFALQSSLMTNITFNGGVLNLDDTLTFGDGKSYVGTGTIHFNGHQLNLGGTALTLTGTFVFDANLTLNGPTTLTGNTTFGGSDTLQGNGNILTLAPGATITIASNAVVNFTDVIIKGIGTGGGSIIFQSNGSELHLSNADFDLVGNATQTQGKIFVEGPSTWIVRDSIYTFAGTSLLTVDGVTLWKDQAGTYPSAGTIAFASPANVSLLNEATICLLQCGDILATSTGFLQSQIDTINISPLRTSTGFLQSQIDACCTSLRTSTGFLQSEIDTISTAALRTSTGFLQSQIDACCTSLRTSTGFLQSEIDRVFTLLRTSTGFLQSEIDACCNALKTSTGFLQSEIDAINIGLITQLRTSTGFLQSEIDACCNALKTSTGLLQSEIDAVNTGLITQLRTSTGFLQSEIDTCCNALKTSTGFLQSEIDTINTGLITQLRTSTGFLQSEIDACCNALKTSTGFLQSEIDAINTGLITQLQTSTGFLQSEIDACCNALKTSTGFLQSEIDACCNALKTSTGFLQSEIDAVNTGLITQLRTSTGFLQSEIDTCCNALKTSTGFLQSEIDTINTGLITQLRTSTGFLQSEIDACCNALKTSTGFLQSEIDANLALIISLTGGQLLSQIEELASILDEIITNTVPGLVSTIEELISLVDTVLTASTVEIFQRLDALETSTGFLQSEIDACCNALKTSTGFLQSEIDACCAALGTSTGFLQSQIDQATTVGLAPLITSTGFLQSQIDACCASLATSTGFLQSEIDSIDFEQFAALATSTGFLQSEIDACCNALITSTGFLQSQIDEATTAGLAPLITSTGFLQSQIDEATTAGLAPLITSTGFLQSQIDACCASLATSTGFLQSEIDSIDFEQFAALATSTGFLQSEIDACCNALKTSTGFLQSQIDACCASLATSTGFLQSEIDSIDFEQFAALATSTGFLQSEIDACCTVLKTSTGFLQSQIDEATTAGLAPLITSTGFLQSQIDACCASLATSTGFLQSEIDSIDFEQFAALATSTGFLQSEIDACCNALKTSTGFLQSQIDQATTAGLAPLITSTGFLQSQIDACCASLATSTGFLQSEIDACCNALKTSTGFLQSEIDLIKSVTFINILDSRLEFLETCCAQLRTSTGFLQSEIDELATTGGSVLATSTGFLQSQIDAIAIIGGSILATSTGFLQSQIDSICSMTCITMFTSVFSRIEILETCCADLQTSTGFLQSQLDIIETNTDFISRIEVLETCCEQLKTSTGFLQSEIDFLTGILESSIEFLQSEIDSILCPVHCCEIDFLTSTTDDCDVKTVDWSFDGRFIAIGLGGNFGNCLTHQEVKVYELVGSSLILRAQISLGTSVNEVTVVRWQPNAYRLAVGRRVLTNNITDPRLHILNFDPIGFSLSQISSAEIGNEVFAASWRKKPLANGNNVLVVGRNVAIQQLVFYTVDSFGALSGPFSPNDTDGTISDRAIDWDKQDSYVVVGVDVTSSKQSLQIYAFDQNIPSLSFVASTQVDAVSTSTISMATVAAVDWNQTYSNLIAVGLQCSGGEIMQLFAFDSNTNILEHRSGISGLTQSVIALDWHPDGNCIALAQSEGQFSTYSFDGVSSFSLASTFNDFNGMGVNDMRWNAKGNFIANGNDNDNVSVYSTTCHRVNICDLISRVEHLETCCDQLRTSTGFLQSEIDIILCPVNCCDVHPVTDITADNSIETVDWSFDNKFIAIGLSNKQPNGGPASDQNVLKVYELVGNTLVFRAELILGTTFGEVTQVRWHPTMYRLAVSRQFIDVTNTENRLHVIDFNPTLNTLIQQSSQEAVDVFAVSWRKVGLSDGNDLLAVGRKDVTGDNVALHTVTPSGILSAPLWTVQPGSAVSLRAIDWDATNQYIAVGIQAGPGHDSLQIYQLDATIPTAPTLTFVTSLDVTLSSGIPTANAVSWNPIYTDVLAVGYAMDDEIAAPDQLVQTFRFNGATLTQTSGIAGLDLTVRTLDWHPDGLCLAVGKDGQLSSTFEFAVYGFNNSTFSLSSSPTSAFSTVGNVSVKDVRWAPNGTYIAHVGDDAMVSIYKNNCPQLTICDLISRIENLETCCEILRTSTGLLQSEIDFVISLTNIEACFATCSRIDALEKNYAFLATSTGFLQSEIDSIVPCECQDLCQECKVNFLTSDANFADNIATADWSFDNRFIAIGLSNNNTLADSNVLKIYELVGTSLILRAEFAFNKQRNVGSIRWHPNQYRLAVGRVGQKEGADESQLHIFNFDPLTYMLNSLGQGEIDTNVYALSWRPKPLDNENDLLAVGRDKLNEVALYQVTSGGVLSITPQVVASTKGTIQLQAMDWDLNGLSLAVGVEQASAQHTLQIFTYEADIPSLTLNASIDVSSVVFDDMIDHTVLSLDWNKKVTSQTLLAVGLSNGPGGQLVQLFKYDSNAGILIKQCGIDHLEESIRALDWHPNGTCLAVGQSSNIDQCSKLITYVFNKASCSFTESKIFTDFGGVDIETVRWSVNGRYIVAGNDTRPVDRILCFLDNELVATPGRIIVYDNNCLSIQELVSLIEGVQVCCGSLMTSTGQLQSQIDELVIPRKIDGLSSLAKTTSLRIELDVLPTLTQINTENLLSFSCTKTLNNNQFNKETNNIIAPIIMPLPKITTNTKKSKIEEVSTIVPKANLQLPILPQIFHSLLDQTKVNLVEEQKSCISQLDIQIDSVQKTNNNLISKINECDTCSQGTLTEVNTPNIISKMETFMENCVTTSQDTADIMAYECVHKDCFSFELLTRNENFKDTVATSDWSYDNKFIAIGLSNEHEISDAKVLKVYELVDSGLMLRSEFSFDKNLDVSVIKWHPALHQLAVGRVSKNKVKEDQPQLHIFNFAISTIESGDSWNTNRYTLSLMSEQAQGQDVYALSWCLPHLKSDNSVLAVGRNHEQEIALYQVSPHGIISAAPTITASTKGKIQAQAMDWNIRNNMLAVGCQAELQIFEYNSIVPSLTLNTALPIKDIQDNQLIDQTVLAVDWNKTKVGYNILAIGLSSDANRQVVQLYKHYPSDSTLIKLCGIENIDDSSNALSWHPSGRYLTFATNKGIEYGSKLYSYLFDIKTSTLTQQHVSDDFNDVDIKTISWSHDGSHLIIGNESLHIDPILQVVDKQVSHIPGCLSLYGKSCMAVFNVADQLNSYYQTCVDNNMELSLIDNTINILGTSTHSLISDIDEINICTEYCTTTECLVSLIDDISSYEDINSYGDTVLTDTVSIHYDIDLCIAITDNKLPEIDSSSILLTNSFDVLSTTPECLIHECSHQDCYGFELLTRSENFKDTVASSDWSYDNKFIAIGLSNEHEISDAKVLKVYELVDSGLMLRAEFSFDKNFDVSVIKWHPRLHQLAVGRVAKGKNHEDQTQLHIFNFNTNTYKLNLVSEGAQNQNVYALSWCLSKTDDQNSILAVGRNCEQEIALYQISQKGIMASAPQVTTSTKSNIHPQAMDWNVRNNMLAVGCRAGIQIFEYNPIIPSLKLNAEIDMNSMNDDQVDQTVLTLEWNKTKAGYNILAIGSSSEANRQVVQLYKHSSDSTLIKLCGIDNLDDSINALSWHPNGTYLTFATNKGVEYGAKLYSYLFDIKTSTLIPESIHDHFGDINIKTVRWAKNGTYLITGNESQPIDPILQFIDKQTTHIPGKLHVYGKSCIALFDGTNFTKDLSLYYHTLTDNSLDLPLLENMTQELDADSHSIISINDELDICTECLTNTDNMSSSIDYVISFSDQIISSIFAFSDLDQSIMTTHVLISENNTSSSILTNSWNVLSTIHEHLISQCGHQDSYNLELLIDNQNYKDTVATADWSYDNRFIAIGLNNDKTLSDVKVLKIYELVNSNLILRTEYAFEKHLNISIVKWHPTLHQLAIGRIDKAHEDQPQLHIINFNPHTYNLNLASEGERGHDVYALSWCLPEQKNSLLTIGRDHEQGIALYQVSQKGIISSVPVITASTKGKIQLQAMDWNTKNNMLAVGCEAELQIFEYNHAIPSLGLNTALQVKDIQFGQLDSHSVLAVGWNKARESDNILAIGLSSDSGRQLVKIFEHDQVTGTLTQKSGINSIHNSVCGLHWHPQGKCLALSVDMDIHQSGELLTYLFNPLTYELIQHNKFDNFGDVAIKTIRWSHCGNYLIAGSKTNSIDPILQIIDKSPGHIPGQLHVYVKAFYGNIGS